MEERFEKVYSQGVLSNLQVWVDKATGVQYLFLQNGSGAGLCPLVDTDGKPLVLSL